MKLSYNGGNLLRFKVIHFEVIHISERTYFMMMKTIERNFEMDLIYIG